MAAIVAWRQSRHALRITRRELACAALIGLLLPGANGLLFVSERTVPTGVASLIIASVPLLVVLLRLAGGERPPRLAIVGVLVGFVGVAILVGFDVADLTAGNAIGELALIGATISYAAGNVYAKRNIHGLRPMIPALFQVFFGLLITGTLAFATEHPLSVAWTPEAILAVVWLGLLGSGLAYLSYFRILQHWGATRTSLVAYLLPVWGIALGAIVLGEPIGVTMLVGTALIIGGIALVNARYGTRPLYVRGGIRPAATPPGDPAVQPGSRP
jgi:drug/metabolite transporter (DMT)-like permease